jgi:hypothetical protein
MKTNDIKVMKLIQSGMSFGTLKGLNENQISILYKRMIKEQEDEGVIITKDASKAENMAKKGLNVRLEKEMGEGMSPLEKDAEQDYTGQEGPHDEKDMAPDGMDDDSDNNRKMMGEKQLEEKAVSKQQQKFMGLVKAYKEGDVDSSEVTKKVKDAAKSMTKKEVDKFAGTKHKGLPKKVEESRKNDYLRSVKQIEKTLMELVQKNIPKKMTKEEFMRMVEQGAPSKSPSTSPSEPMVIPDAPTKPGKPQRQNPYKPKHKPAPKAKDDETFAMKLPKMLQFDKLNIKFKDEKKG